MGVPSMYLAGIEFKPVTGFEDYYVVSAGGLRKSAGGYGWRFV